MNQGFGIERPHGHSGAPHREPARYLMLIDTDGSVIARLFVASRTQVAEFDASSEEVARMTLGLVPSRGASGQEWDRALDGHTTAQRSAASIYTLDL